MDWAGDVTDVSQTCLTTYKCHPSIVSYERTIACALQRNVPRNSNDICAYVGPTCCCDVLGADGLEVAQEGDGEARRRRGRMRRRLRLQRKRMVVHQSTPHHDVLVGILLMMVVMVVPCGRWDRLRSNQGAIDDGRRLYCVGSTLLLLVTSVSRDGLYARERPLEGGGRAGVGVGRGHEEVGQEARVDGRRRRRRGGRRPLDWRCRRRRRRHARRRSQLHH